MIVNGQEVENGEGLTMLSFLSQQGYQVNRIAVEYNGKILPKSQYESVILQKEDHLEIVHFVGGG